jgi:hypothetical protein
VDVETRQNPAVYMAPAPAAACRQVTHPFTQQDLRLLTGLSELQELTIGAAESLLQQEGEELQDFPGRLTALTKLRLSLEAGIDLSSVSGCVALQDLQVRPTYVAWAVVVCRSFTCSRIYRTKIYCLCSIEVATAC